MVNLVATYQYKMESRSRTRGNSARGHVYNFNILLFSVKVLSMTRSMGLFTVLSMVLSMVVSMVLSMVYL